MAKVHDDLRALVDALPDDRAGLLLRGLPGGDRTALYLVSVPEDDEPVTEQERAAVAEALEDVRAGRLLSWAEVSARWAKG